MHKLTFFPTGNADCCRVDLANGKKLLFDYADTCSPDDASDKRINLDKALRDDLKAAKRSDYNVVAFTHLDDDHICGSTEFFELLHDKRYQGGDRVRITELWVPAFVICEDRKLLSSMLFVCLFFYTDACRKIWGLIYNHCVRTKRGQKEAFATSKDKVVIYKKLDGRMCTSVRKL